MIARRGKNSRVAAMGVSKAARRQGVGRTIMERAIEDAKTRGDLQLLLEVIEQNPPAIELYKSVGFQIQHRLIGFEGRIADAAPDGATLTDCTFSEVAAPLRKRGFLASSWSMGPATVEVIANPSRAVRVGDVFAVIGVSGEETVACRSLSFSTRPTIKATKAWLAAMASEFAGRKLFIPAFFPEPEYKDALTGAGLEIAAISQFQMVNDLGNLQAQQQPGQASYKAGPAQPALLK
jgi:hypothetical protein